MNKSTRIFIGKNQLLLPKDEVKGEQVKIGEEDYYKISNVDTMRPFFMNIVSSSNHWMFISSNGGLSAGRVNSNRSLFPYYTDDKLTEFSEITGSKTLLKVFCGDKIFLWEPFSSKYEGIYKITRNLYKNTYGNKIVFEEINENLGLIFQYHWNTSEKYGFIRKSILKNTTSQPVSVEILDGVQNIMPYGVAETLQVTSSNLVDAYKKNELEVDSGLGIYALSAIIVDKAEPSEALKATTVWSLGVDCPKYLLSSLQLDAFRAGKELKQEVNIKAEKGAYFINEKIELAGNSEKQWLFILEVEQSVSAIIEIKQWQKEEKNLAKKIQEDIDAGTQQLISFSGNADGVQLTADRAKDMRHFSNTLFNIMRGGIFDDNYNIERQDFLTYLNNANTVVFKEKEQQIQKLPSKFSIEVLHKLAEEDSSADFKRLCIEYMPLKFSRRHGDPSRPWNKFSINMKNEVDGSKILDYEGNWRDIFQNWEALVHAYPKFIDSMIHKFLNATTFEGYNPYRVTKGGFDWETIEADDPWSYIGYWGDHQIIYLLKFLEFCEKYYPNTLAEYFSEECFVYANVPYKIKNYAKIVNNPKDTIDFDYEADKLIRKYRDEIGADGALLKNASGQIYHVNFIEKILVTITAKLSNFIPDAGIWMNTQRPEWNDANNALVGNGVSMVTLYYLRRFLHFFDNLLNTVKAEKVSLSEEFVLFFEEMYEIFNTHQSILLEGFSNKDRKTLMDNLGNAASTYRLRIYEKGFSAKKKDIDYKSIKEFIQISLKYVEHSIETNKRTDKLYHSYNLITIENDAEVSISYLSEMLEGQVAVLSSGYLSSKASLELLDALKSSALFRADQYSYILYPNKELARFIDKNTIPEKAVSSSKLLRQLVKDNNKQVIEQDVLENYHFNGTFNNANSLKVALNNLPKNYQKLVAEEEQQLLIVFEEVFNHKAFTGRSGTFFGYEGLGSIYWHMVSKLALAVQETCLKAIQEKEDAVTIGKLLEHYYEICEGLGVHKSPQLYGAFPTDPYSHTPATKGAQQPGMTGQVKEDILTRFSELGIVVKNGMLYFQPYNLLRKDEFLSEDDIFIYYDVQGNKKSEKIKPNSLCFTYCQVPVIYQFSENEYVEVTYKDNTIAKHNELCLDKKATEKIFSRSGEIVQLVVALKRDKLR